MAANANQRNAKQAELSTDSKVFWEPNDSDWSVGQ